MIEEYENKMLDKNQAANREKAKRKTMQVRNGGSTVIDADEKSASESAETENKKTENEKVENDVN